MRFIITVVIFMTCFAVTKSGEAPSSAQSPATSCSSIIYDLVDCIPFLSEGSKDKKPMVSCCIGFKTVLRADDKCICEALKSRTQLGIEVNLSRAATLPSACGVSTPSISKCDVSSAPTTPGPSPGTTPSPSPGTAPSTSTGTSPPITPPTKAPAKPPSTWNGSPSPNQADTPTSAGADVPVNAPSPSNITLPLPPSGEDWDGKPALAPAISSGSNFLSACFFMMIISMIVVA